MSQAPQFNQGNQFNPGGQSGYGQQPSQPAPGSQQNGAYAQPPQYAAAPTKPSIFSSFDLFSWIGFGAIAFGLLLTVVAGIVTMSLTTAAGFDYSGGASALKASASALDARSNWMVIGSWSGAFITAGGFVAVAGYLRAGLAKRG